ncbi:hypothetical protein PVAP13_2KG201558 [Panicum virgatum]|uniref:Uncharacterized protein n=1 Tax=Panicum virgatum TaxID=38727 RepID=A0A8T0W4A8_PANVG|nr:hypothetical protein PVAP13_2KG201558 [Panicum virgatum]
MDLVADPSPPSPPGMFAAMWDSERRFQSLRCAWRRVLASSLHRVTTRGTAAAGARSRRASWRRRPSPQPPGARDGSGGQARAHPGGGGRSPQPPARVVGTRYARGGGGCRAGGVRRRGSGRSRRAGLAGGAREEEVVPDF